MSSRPKPPLNVQRMLWYESIGHCMNPECQTYLFQSGTSIADMAHIIEDKDDGDVSFENLLLLCKNCHNTIDANRTETTIGTLQNWKDNRNREIEEHFAQRYDSFVRLTEAVVPILKRNGQIFESYGPESGGPDNEDRHELWLKFEAELISNNRRLELILTHSIYLLPIDNRRIVESFVSHSREFAETRGDTQIKRVNLFPKELLSIFGIEPTPIGLPSSLSALQNFIRHLIRFERFRSLNLNGEPSLTYIKNGKTVTLSLLDRPRLQQIFWNGHFFRPLSTQVRTDNLVFFVNWLYKNNINYSFPDMPNLTHLTLNQKYHVRLSYSYILSISDLHAMGLNHSDIVVNQHIWNGAPVSEQAQEYASQIGVRLFSQNEFFVYAHNKIK